MGEKEFVPVMGFGEYVVNKGLTAWVSGEEGREEEVLFLIEMRIITQDTFQQLTLITYLIYTQPSSNLHPF